MAKAYQEVEVLQLICTKLLRLGNGTPDDPIRIITQYWTMDGDLVFAIDPEELRRKKARDGE